MQPIKKSNLKKLSLKNGLPVGRKVWKPGPSNGTIDTDILIRRLPFSQDDAKKDPEQYKNLCTALGGADNGGTRLWWDTGKNNF